MSSKSSIEWTDATWNPITGCTKVSEGCKNCYAETWANRHIGDFAKKHPSDADRKFSDIRFHSEKLMFPVLWKKPKRIFVNSMSDLFHADISNEQIYSVFATMAAASWHTYQILTKRPERMLEWFQWLQRVNRNQIMARLLQLSDVWPLPNVWLGVSVENQAAADARIPLLTQTPAAVRFMSCEPLLGPLILPIRRQIITGFPQHITADGNAVGAPTSIHWVIVGGESGPHERPMNPVWARSLRDQCKTAGIPFFFKQWGEWGPQNDINGLTSRTRLHAFADHRVVHRVGKKLSGRMLDGREWNEMPATRATP